MEEKLYKSLNKINKEATVQKGMFAYVEYLTELLLKNPELAKDIEEKFGTDTQELVDMLSHPSLMSFAFMAEIVEYIDSKKKREIDYRQFSSR